ncbi:MAG: zinc ribbon domain-containing protein [Acidobacteriota bacterium]|jgi:hypothetical protein
MQCPDCGSENPPDSRECLCGHPLSPERDSISDDPTAAENARYFPVSVLKFWVMSVSTLGVYPLYWLYRNWSYVRERDNSNIWPPVRAFFGVFSYPFLLRDLNDEESRLRKEGPQLAAAPSVLGLSAAYFAANMFWFVPGAALLGWPVLIRTASSRSTPNQCPERT